MIVFPGTFDPVTLGHQQLVARAKRLFGRVIVAVAAQPNGRCLFALEERLMMAQLVWEDDDQVEVVPMKGLLVDYLKEVDCHVVLRGLRNAADFSYEQHMQAANSRLSDAFECCYLATEVELLGVSSSVVREVFQFGGDVRPFVPESVAECLVNMRSADGANHH